MDMSEFTSGVPYPWPIQFPFAYPATSPMPPFQQYVQSPQDIQIIAGLTPPQRGRIPSTYYPHNIFLNNRDFVPKREKKILQIIDPSTKEEICVERNSGSLNVIDDSLQTNLSNSPKQEKLKKQQEFRQLIASAAIKDIDRSPENKIKDEFKSKVSVALTPDALSDEEFHDDGFIITDDTLQSPKIHAEGVVPSMEFPNSNGLQDILPSIPKDIDDTPIIPKLHTNQHHVSMHEPSLIRYEYSRDIILDLQPDLASKFDVPSEIKLSKFLCICISELFFYRQPTHSHHLFSLNPSAKSREKDKMNERLTWILNRITPENYEKLSKKAIDLVATAETIEDLENFIHCIFSKSINEPIYCEFYARLCNDMAKIFIREDSNTFDSENTIFDAKQVTFRRCLLTICQQEFEKDKNDNEQLIQMKLKLESCTDMEQKVLLSDEYQLKEKEVHKHSLGNVRLIGQLYRLNMLSENIIHECTVRLLKGRPTDDYLEELCSLFNVVGMDIDKPEAKDRIDQYFERIQHLMNRGFMSTRVKYLLMNLIDLRSAGWCERREKEIPKTLDELHNINTLQSVPPLVPLKESPYSQLTPKIDKPDDTYSSAKISTSRLPSLKKHDEIKFRPSSNWPNKYKDIKESFRLDPDISSELPVVSTTEQSNVSFNESTDLLISGSTSILKEYDHLHDFDEVRQFLLVTYSPPQHSLIVCGFFLSLNVTGGKLRSTLASLLVNCYQQNVLSEEHLNEGILLVIKHIIDEDIPEDCPLIFEFVFEVVFSLYSQVTHLSLVLLVNLLSHNDFLDTVVSFLHFSYTENAQLLVSMITNSVHNISDDVLTDLLGNASALYEELRLSIFCQDYIKTHFIQPIDFKNTFNDMKTRDSLLNFLDKIYTDMKISFFMKPMFIIEILLSHHLNFIRFEMLEWLATIFCSAFEFIPRHFHSSIFIFFLKNLRSSSPINQEDNFNKFISLPSFRNVITNDILKTICENDTIGFSIINTIKSTYST
ncbi:Eukaryotic translation initiation factor 4 gamma 1 isoform X1 [Oopsacas minuta]|uniref:Eukaryotic translation initiation factor 4 gamma 1 isoform X1 n=1 Tax=Oopsacas minuta TaxID=111878 RepID=A0AAV7KGS6_9METZ|nr:Eukaryotic translation initiation factor 4 gamma 1 isoform X1 [Oopsacas minuta]